MMVARLGDDIKLPGKYDGPKRIAAKIALEEHIAVLLLNWCEINSIPAPGGQPTPLQCKRIDIERAVQELPPSVRRDALRIMRESESQSLRMISKRRRKNGFLDDVLDRRLNSSARFYNACRVASELIKMLGYTEQ